MKTNSRTYFPPRDVRTAGAKILYTEDEPTILRLASLVLTRSGYSVTAVENGHEAWEVLQAESFDLLVTDNDMGRLTGLELITQARLAGIDLPIIVASASAGQFTGKSMDWLRLSAILPKPFTTDDLLDSVQRVLRANASNLVQREVRLPAFAEAAVWIEPPHQHWGINE